MEARPFLFRQSGRFVAIAMGIALYLLARDSQPAADVRKLLASRFRFESVAIPELDGTPKRSIQAVNPSLRRIDGWISAVGAGIALVDLDGDGLANDICQSEPRTGQLIIQPVPGTGARYAAFALDPGHGAYREGTYIPTGCTGADFNEDGRLDLLVNYWGRSPVIFLRVTGETQVAPSAFEASELMQERSIWYTSGSIAGDFDGDGHLDIFAGNYFQDGTELFDADARSIAKMHNTKSRSFNGGGKHLFLWRKPPARDPGKVSWQRFDLTANGGLEHGWTLAAGAADIDGDGLAEIYLANDFGPDQLLHNRSQPGKPAFAAVRDDRKFRMPASFALGQDSFKGMGVDFADINKDGTLDIAVSNIADSFALNESHFMWLSSAPKERIRQELSPYVQASERMGLSRSGWGWDLRMVDFDNDGTLEVVQATGFMRGRTNRWPELQALGTGNDKMMDDPRHWPSFKDGDDLSGDNHMAFFVAGPAGRYVNVGREAGFDVPLLGRGIAVADVNGDGCMDFALASQWMESHVYINQCESRFSYLNLLLKHSMDAGSQTQVHQGRGNAVVPGRVALGAAAALTLPDGGRIAAVADGGSGHSGKRSPEIHFGLGSGLAPGFTLPVDLKWRDVRGRLRSETMRLEPGSYTIVLGNE